MRPISHRIDNHQLVFTPETAHVLAWLSTVILELPTWRYFTGSCTAWNTRSRGVFAESFKGLYLHAFAYSHTAGPLRGRTLGSAPAWEAHHIAIDVDASAVSAENNKGKSPKAPDTMIMKLKSI
jgi:hypothetical protein